MAGEVAIKLDGRSHTARLTLGALAELEAGLDGEGLVPLIGRFEVGAFTQRDVLAVLVAGLRGGGWQGRTEDLVTVQIGGGAAAAARIAAELLLRSFRGPE